MTPSCLVRSALPAAVFVLASAHFTAAGGPPFVPTLQPYRVPNPRPFLVSGGKEILVIDFATARAFRFAMPE